MYRKQEYEKQSANVTLRCDTRLMAVYLTEWAQTSLALPYR